MRSLKTCAPYCLALICFVAAFNAGYYEKAAGDDKARVDVPTKKEFDDLKKEVEEAKAAIKRSLQYKQVDFAGMAQAGPGWQRVARWGWIYKFPETAKIESIWHRYPGQLAIGPGPEGANYYLVDSHTIGYGSDKVASSLPTTTFHVLYRDEGAK